MRVISISDGNRLTVDLLDFGARIAGIRFNDVPVALGYENLCDYQNDAYYIGASIGPISNRLANAQLSINGQRFSLPANEGANCLHSGGRGFDQKTWTLLSNTYNSVEYELYFDLADIGLRGQLNTRARYTVHRGALTIEYLSHTDTDTYINLTNHVYFNLSGRRQTIADHRFDLFAKSWLNVDKTNIPTGEIIKANSPIKYQLKQSSERDVDIVDHHFEVGQDRLMKLMLKAHSPTTGIGLEVRGTSPGFQFYDGHYLDKPFISNQGFSVETQYAPDAINQKNFYSPLLTAGELRNQITVLQFLA